MQFLTEAAFILFDFAFVDFLRAGNWDLFIFDFREEEVTDDSEDEKDDSDTKDGEEKKENGRLSTLSCSCFYRSFEFHSIQS